MTIWKKTRKIAAIPFLGLGLALIMLGKRIQGSKEPEPFVLTPLTMV
jgi:hypothetical protein